MELMSIERAQRWQVQPMLVYPEGQSPLHRGLMVEWGPW
jgi:hypothetical protein